MPAKSKAQQRLMAAAEHGASFPAAKKLRQSMSQDQLHDFAATKTTGLPRHVSKAHAKKTFEHEAHAYNFRSRNNLKRG
jgi:hypothetical protein